MFPAIKLQNSNPRIPLITFHNTRSLFPCRSLDLRLLKFRFACLSVQSEGVSCTPPPSRLISSVGSPPLLNLSQWNLTHRHILLLNAIACATAISATWLFFSAIPTVLAFKKAAVSLEKLLDVTREELPDTMAAVRLSGIEISDLTMELSDLGQEITQGVRSSTRAVRLAEDRLRRLTTMAPTAMVQEEINLETETEAPVLAKSARSLREGIVNGREVLKIFFSLTQFSRLALNYFAGRGKKP